MPALAPARPKIAAERQQVRAPALPVVRNHPRVTGDAATLLYLQRTAGNAAVTSLIESQSPSTFPKSRSPSGGGSGWGFPVQRCPGGACNCPPEEREAHESASPFTVQRGFWDSIGEAASALLPESIRSVVTGSTGQAQAAAGDLRAHAGAVTGKTHGHGGKALEHSTNSARTAASSSQAQMRGHTQKAEAKSNESLKTATAHTAHSEAGTSGLGAISSIAPGLLNPVGPIVALPEFQQAVEHVESVLAAIPGGAADLAVEIKKAVTDGFKAGHTGGWDCDQSEIMAIAAGVERAITNAEVKAGKKILGEDRYDALAAWANERVADIKHVAATVRAQLKLVKQRVQAFFKQRIAPLIKGVKALMAGLGKLKDRLVKWAGKEFKKAKRLAANAWHSIKTNIIAPVMSKAHAAKARVTQLAERARLAIGSWWNKLPPLAQKAIMGVGAIIAGPFALALLGAEKAGKALAEMAEQLARRLKEMSDHLLKSIAQAYRPLRKKIKDAAASLKARWKSIRKSAGHFLAAAYARLDGVTGGRITRLTAALKALKHKIAGEVCTALGDATGPCIEHFVPNSIKGQTEADVTLTTNADVTVPVYGVPVKVGQGASLKLSREGTNYTATESGEGLIAVAIPKAGGEGGGGAAMSLGISALGQGTAWNKLTGKDVNPNPSPESSSPSSGSRSSSSPEGGSKSPSPSGGGQGEGPEIEGEAGYKANIEMAYAFRNTPGRDKTCDGLGGLTAFLSAQGLSHVLPPPFDMLANQAVTQSYAENLTSCIAALIQYGNAKVNLKQDGIGGLEAALKAQGKVAIEHSKDEKEGWIDTATLSESLGASGSVKLATGGDMPLNISGEASAGATGTLYSKLKYTEATGKISALGAGAKLELSLDADPLKVQAVFPTNVAQPLLEKITAYRQAGQKGSLEVEAKYEVTNLDELIVALDSYFNDTPVSSVNTEGLFNVVNDYLAKAKTEQELTVKYSTSESLAKVAVGVDAKEGGGNVSAEAVRNVKRTIYSYKAGEADHGA